MMRLTVLGASPACQNPGGACSGYLLEQDGAALVIDCGAGVFGRLQHYIDPEKVQAVIISHMHADHTLDLVQYRYYLSFLHDFRGSAQQPLLLLPPGGHQHLLRVSTLQDQSPLFFSEIFQVKEYDPSSLLQLGPVTITWVPVVHIPHTYALRIQGEALFAFSADSGPCPALYDVARESDLFLCECANLETATYPFHLTPHQAAAIAQSAGARRLLLTHRWWKYGKQETVAQAQTEYTGPVELAEEDLQIILAP
jgi:ribonuclease BN (tRNA processing enzyme)